MKMIYQKISALFVLLLISFSASADFGIRHFDKVEPHMYLGIGASFIDVEVDVDGVGSTSFNSELLGVIIGYQFNSNFAVEFRGYGNISDDEILGVSIEAENHFNILGRAILPIDRYIKPYLLAGVGRTKGKLASESESETDFLYGVGIGISKGNALELSVEWARAFDDSFGISGANFKGDTINLNLVYHLPRDWWH
ncbi:porin family protein [Photobacterium rosenbergii]|uniref:porin family protein n=1 Tax=Photobacterium rosenbergii TaxID=294936 RepID=UPI001C99AD3C|nr:porin family protein [Photobacterium rosenbergii]MBY5945017.1 porin family protein [Photobacterium rosenbergii]